MTNRDLLTVIVPTRERPDTLVHCLRTLVSQTDSRLEIIVSDNCSAPETKAVVDAFQSDPRIRYIRPDSRLGMSEHWEFALNHAKGNWVTFIGDDDGLLPDAVTKFFDLIKGRDVKAVSTNSCKFWWSNPERNIASKLTVQMEHGAEVRLTKDWLIKVLHAQENFQVLPYIYTGGFVSIETINEIKAKCDGVFFRSITPDAYSGIAVALVLDSYLFSWDPLALAGLSKHSNGQQQMTWRKEDPKKISFFSESKLGFHPKLGNGMIQSVPMLIYEAFLRASPLYKTNFDIKMEDQLALSIAYAEKTRQKEAYEYCEEVSKENGLDFTAVLKKLPLIRLEKKIAKIKKNFSRVLFPGKKEKNQKISGDSTLNNIYDASQKAGSILQKCG